MVKEKKPKTKKSHWDTLCTEVERDVWEWTTWGGKTWRYWNGRSGMNLYNVQEDGSVIGVIYAKNLNDAVMWTLGYAARDGQSEDKIRTPEPTPDPDQPKFG